MRTIKFKAKIKCSYPEWVEGSLLYDDGQDAYYIVVKTFDIEPPKLPTQFGVEAYEVDPTTVCQFTGLKDKEGKDIWEGDTIHRHMNVHWVVVFKDSAWVAIGQMEYNKIPDANGLYLDAKQFIECEITGNIHDQ